ncbi:L-type lectin-domain containing protein [Caballeronia sp. GAFFF1]|uniref:L-type lectin-domain containing protein n=1 Tax=Caballeronia sp. GAFFF1 TaxID=2921779 RepID=UPI002028E6F0|nr:L-type lectin-domain containing protein [Caballeronia sp. GAFFF1]
MNVLTQRNDPGRTGVNPAETRLNPGNVNLNSFGLLRRVPLGHGAVYAQPLYVSRLRFPDGHDHETAFVATMGNVLTAIDVDTGATLAEARFPEHPAVDSHRWFDIGQPPYQDIVGSDREEHPTIGILSTPVIDLARHEIYLVLCTVDEKMAENHSLSDDERAGAFRFILYSLDLTTLQKKRNVVIGGSVAGTGYLSSKRARSDERIKVSRHNGDLKVTTKLRIQNPKPEIDTLSLTDATGTDSPNPRVHFIAMTLLQRPALLLVDGVLWIAFGSRGDINPWHGWVFAYRSDNLAQIDLLCTTPNGAQGGIWQAGQGLLSDSDGNVYAGTGNGDSKPVTDRPGTANMGESFVKMRLTNDRIEVLGWYNAFDDLDYMPGANDGDEQDAEEIKAKDDDLGASAPALLPDNRIVGGGKDGYFYLIDTSQLIHDAAARQIAPKADNVVLQYFLASYNPHRGTRAVAPNVTPVQNPMNATHHIHGAPVVWQGDAENTLVYVWGENDVARAYRYALRLAGQPLAGGFVDQGAIAVAPIVTADWRDVLPKHGMEAARSMTVASNECPGRDGMPGGFLSLSWDGQHRSSAILWALFPPFKNANHYRVDGELIAFDASNFDPQKNFSRMNSLWRSSQDPEGGFSLPKFCCPTIANGKVLVPDGDGTSLLIYGLRGTGGGYDLSSEAGTAGFGANEGLTFNGTARVSLQRKILLTDNAVVTNPKHDNDSVGRAFVPTFQSGSVFSTSPVDVVDFSTRFTISMRGIDILNMADGLTFTVQSAGPHALGSSGSGLGYAEDPFDTTNTTASIAPSIAVAFNVVDNSMSIWRDGVKNNLWTHNLGDNGIALNSGHALRVNVQFIHAAKKLTLTVEDQDPPHATTGPLTIDDIDLVSFLKLGNPPRAHVGFTGGTGGKSAAQIVLSWSVP